jgi:hypothetical protein
MPAIVILFDKLNNLSRHICVCVSVMCKNEPSHYSVLIFNPIKGFIASYVYLPLNKLITCAVTLLSTEILIIY